MFSMTYVVPNILVPLLTVSMLPRPKDSLIKISSFTGMFSILLTLKVDPQSQDDPGRQEDVDSDQDKEEEEDGEEADLP